MNKLLGLIILFAVISCGQKEIDLNQLVEKNGLYYEIGSDRPFSGTAINLYENNQTESIWTYKNGIKDGPHIRYLSNGTIYAKSNFKNGLNDGYYESYYDNGLLKEKRNYISGIKDGSFEYFYPNGELNYRNTFENGALNGPFEHYTESGLLDVKGIYKNGNATFVEGYIYYENGNLQAKEILQGPGKGTYEAYFENGQIREKEVYQDGVKIKSD